MKDKILVNDIIKVNSTENVDSYSFYDSWFAAYDISTNNQYGTPLSKHIRSVDESYECIWAAPNHTTGVQLYAIEGMDSHKIFLVDSNSISTYSHTCHSYDNTEDALRLISKQYRKLLVELDEAQKEIDRLTPKIDVPCEDSTLKNPMPPLENGMYGIMASNEFDSSYKFLVRNGAIILDDGRVFNIEEFENENTLGPYIIVEIITGIGSFNDYDKGAHVWSIFDGDNGAAVN